MEKLLVAIITLLIIVMIMPIRTINANIGQSPKEVEDWVSKVNESKSEKVTKLRFYFHGSTNADKNRSSVVVAKAPPVLSSKPPYFGILSVMDDPLTVGPDLSSERVGYARGFYATSSRENISLLLGAAFVFTEGKYNGSTIVFLGQDPILEEYREMPIIGGTGVFRLARGVVTLQTYFYDPAAGVATVEMSLVVLHY